MTKTVCSHLNMNAHMKKLSFDRKLAVTFCTSSGQLRARTVLYNCPRIRWDLLYWIPNCGNSTIFCRTDVKNMMEFLLKYSYINSRLAYFLWSSLIKVVTKLFNTRFL